MTVDSDNSPPPAGHSEPPSTSATQPVPPPEHASSTMPMSNRSELLDRARHFLTSAQVIHQDHESKRRFLTDKGLTDGEIQLLLREMVRRVFSSAQSFTQLVLFFASPRNFPSCRPACTPLHLRPACPAFLRVPSSCFHGSRGAPRPFSSSTMCVGAFLTPHIHTLIGLSLQRFLLPRLTRSGLARRSLKAHQSDLLAKLTESLRDFRDEQKVAYADLPRPDPWEEPVDPWGKCKGLGDVVAAAQGERQPCVVPQVTLLRCTLSDLAGQNKPSTADEIFQALFSTELPSLLNIDDAYQVRRQHYALSGQIPNHFLILGVAVENAQRRAAFPSHRAQLSLRAT
jgi:hypothetical protein